MTTNRKTMNVRILILFISTIVLYSCSSGNEESAEDASPMAEGASPEEEPKEWTLLLEGNTLEHWEMYNQGEIKGWELIDGELHSSGAGWDKDEDIVTKQEYENFELYLEWKITPENSSGIFFHVQRGDHPIYEAAPEYQVMDDEGWPQELKPNQKTAGNYAMHAPQGAQVKPVGEWNTTRIIVNDPHVEHWLNGVKVVEYEKGSDDWLARKAADKWAGVPQYGAAKSGHIGLQNAGKVVYRNIKIREL